MGLKLKVRGGIYYTSGTVTLPTGEKVRVRQTTGIPEGQRMLAEEAQARILHEVMSGRHKKKEVRKAEETLGDAIRSFCMRADPPGETDQQIMGRLDKAMGRRLLRELTTAELHAWANRGNRQAGTVAREIRSVKACLAHAKGAGMPVPEIALRLPSVSDERTRWLTERERDSLITRMPRAIKDHVTFLFFSGARISEALGLKWSEVVGVDEPVESEAFGRAVWLWSKKGRNKKVKWRQVPLPAVARDVLRRRFRKTGGEGLVFGTSRQTKMLSDNFRREWRKGCEKAHIYDFTPHDCRHTYASHLVQKGVSLRAVADLLGHSSLQMVMRYSHLAPSHLEGVVGVFDTKFAQPKSCKGSDEACANWQGEAAEGDAGEVVASGGRGGKANDDWVVPPERLELSTSRLPSECSTSELRRRDTHLRICATREAPASLTKDEDQHLEREG